MAGVDGENADATTGGSGKMQWQVNEKFWKNFAPSANRKLEMYRTAGIPLVRVWDGNLVRELDLRNMECFPGRIGLRRVASDSFAAHTAARNEADQAKASESMPFRPASVGGSRAASLASRPTSRGTQSSSRPSTVTGCRPESPTSRGTKSSSRPNTVSGSRPGSRMSGNGPRPRTPGSDLSTGWDFWSNVSPPGNSTSPLAGLRLNERRGKVKNTEVIPYLNHPILAVMEPPSFSFVDDDATKAFKATDPSEGVVDLASFYAEQLMSSANSLGYAHAPKLPVPAGVPAERVMAALSVALHKVVALPPGFQEGDADSVCSPMARGRKDVASLSASDASQDGMFCSSSRKQKTRRRSIPMSKFVMEKELGPIRIRGQITFVVGRQSEANLVMSHKLMGTWHEWVERARDTEARLILEDKHCKDIVGNLRTLKTIFALVFSCASIWEATLHYYSQGEPRKKPQFLTRARVQPLPADALTSGGFKKAFHFAARHPLTEATALAARGEKVVLGIIGSGTLIGGQSFLMDTADTLEDEVCCCTTLYVQLMEALRIARAAAMADPAGNPVHVPEEGALLLREAWVLRHPADRDYAPLDQPVQLKGIALYSLPNYTYRDTPARGQVVQPWAQIHTKGSYVQKMRMVLHGAIAVGATAIVMSTEGAEELGHDPALIGAALAEVIEFFHGAAPTLHLIGQRSFKQGVVRALRVQRSGRPE